MVHDLFSHPLLVLWSLRSGPCGLHEGFGQFITSLYQFIEDFKKVYRVVFPSPLWCGGEVGVKEHHPLVWWPCIPGFNCTIPPTPLWSCGLWTESCGLHEGSYRVHSVCRWFITYYATPPMWFCGLRSGPCGLHEVYGLLIEGF